MNSLNIPSLSLAFSINLNLKSFDALDEKSPNDILEGKRKGSYYQSQYEDDYVRNDYNLKTKAWFSYVVRIIKIGDFSDPRFLRYMRTCKNMHPSLSPTIPVACYKNRKNQKRFYFWNATPTVPDRLGYL